MNHTFMTAEEVSNKFFNGKYNYQKVLRMTRNGLLPAIKNGKSYLYCKESLEAWTEDNFSCPAWTKIRA